MSSPLEDNPHFDSTIRHGRGYVLDLSQEGCGKARMDSPLRDQRSKIIVLIQRDPMNKCKTLIRVRQHLKPPFGIEEISYENSFQYMEFRFIEVNIFLPISIFRPFLYKA